MKTIDIKGKEYVMVHERIMYFRDKFEGYYFQTEFVELSDARCVMVCNVFNPEGVVISTGHAYEKADSTFINKTSYIENCETSAIGRALGNLGIGIDTSVASAEEVANAIKQQNSKPKLSKKQYNQYIEKIQTGDFGKLTKEQYKEKLFNHFDIEKTHKEMLEAEFDIELNDALNGKK
jgi:hypothetical protein